MGWYGVVTDAGRELITEYIAGITSINIDRITVGSGLVSEENMRQSTNLVYYRDSGSIIEKKDMAHGVDFEFQIGPCSAGTYTAKEIGMWANANTEHAVMLALFQNNEGVTIPSRTVNPDFSYMLSALLAIDNLDTLTITVDSTAYVPYVVFNPYKDSVQEALDNKVDQEEGKGLSHADYTNEEKLKLQGIEDNANKYVLPKATSSTLGGVKVGTGIGVDSNGTISNTGVRGVGTGSANGTISVNTNGVAADVAVKGLGNAAFKNTDTFANKTHQHNASDINAGTLPITRGGTGITSNPSLLTNLGSGSAASVFQGAPRPGVTGVLPVANGGTGSNNASAARTNLGAAAANHTHTPASIGAAAASHTHTKNQIGVNGLPDTIGFFLGNGSFQRVNVGFDISRVILFPFGYRNNTLTTQQNDYAESYSVPGNQRLSRNPSANDPNSVLSWLQSDQDFGLGIVPSGFACNYGGGQFCENAAGVMYMYWAWR